MPNMPLADGRMAIFDEVDLELVSNYSWSSNAGYAYAYVRGTGRVGKKRFILMHRLILGIDDPKLQVDHVNGNRLDNRRCNLRQVTNTENCQNLGAAHADSRTGIRGVCWDKRAKKWIGYVRASGKKVLWSHFINLEDAIAEVEIARAVHMPFSEEGRRYNIFPR